jgi:membrane-associated phospholipid phosphatase
MKRLMMLCYMLLMIAGTAAGMIPFAKSDSLPEKGKYSTVERPITASSFILPGALFGAGATLTFAQSATHHLDSTTQGEIQEDMPGFRTAVDNFLQFAPAVAVFGLNAAGVKGRHTMLQATEYYIVAFLVMAGTTEVLKTATHVQRPDQSDYKSFPSGHTANAFMGAEFLHQEYGHRSVWYSAAGYTTATATGLLRMTNNRHWLGDVIAGAGIGILSTRFSYWLVPRINKAIQKDKHPPIVLKF